MTIKTATYFLPEHLLTYFHYNEQSHLGDRDIEILDSFMEDMIKAHGSFHILSDDEETRNFVRYHDLVGYGWLSDSCVEMTFQVDKE